MAIEEFFDLRIATGLPAPTEADLVRIEDPGPEEVAALAPQGWYYKPIWVTYVLAVPRSMDEHLELSFRPKPRRNIRRLLREVPKRYRLESDPGLKRFAEFRALYLRTVVDRPRGKDRLAEACDEFDRRWTGFFLYAGREMVAGVLATRSRGHWSIAFGAFDPEHRRKFDLEHFLILEVLSRAMREGVGTMSLGVDTNRYGHHLSLGLAPYKLRIGFMPYPYEAGGRELVKVQRFDRFEEGLFFYAYGGDCLVGHLFAREPGVVRAFRHRSAPEIEVHPIGSPDRQHHV